MRRGLTQAWHTANLQRARRMPSLRSFLSRSVPSDKPPKPVAEHKRDFADIVATMGPDAIPVKVRTR